MTHTPVSEVLAMDGPMFRAALAEADAATWEPLHDLLATQAEILHGIFRLLAGALTKGKPPDPLVIPRPNRGDQAGAAKPQRIQMTPGDLARYLRGGAGRGH